MNDTLCAPVTLSMTASTPRKMTAPGPRGFAFASICVTVSEPHVPTPPARSRSTNRTLPGASLTATVNQAGWPAIKSVRASRASRNGRVAAVFAAPGDTRDPEPGVSNKSLVALSAGVSARWTRAFDVAFKSAYVARIRALPDERSNARVDSKTPSTNTVRLNASSSANVAGSPFSSKAFAVTACVSPARTTSPSAVPGPRTSNDTGGPERTAQPSPTDSPSPPPPTNSPR